MKYLRTCIFWCHLATGVVVALVVLLMSVTGVLLTFERQVIAWADLRGLDAGPPAQDAAPLPVGTLLERLTAAEAEGTPTSATWRPGGGPVAVAYGRERTYYVDAYSGAVLGEGATGVRAFFRDVTGWHRWLGAEGEGRRIGRQITGACNLGFLFLVVSGFYLWWPRNWAPKALRNVTLFRRGLSPKARDFNWHNVIGFWSLLPLLVVVGSGVVISYPWASDLVYELAGEAPPAGRASGPPAPANVAPASGDVVAGTPPGQGPASLDDLLARAAGRQPGWRTLTLQVPASTDTTVTFEIDRGTGGQPQKRARLVLDRRTGADVRWEPFAAQAPGRRLRSLLRFAHTGEALGVAGQAFAGAVSLGASLLVWTGLALAWRRFRAWRRRARRP